MVLSKISRLICHFKCQQQEKFMHLSSETMLNVVLGGKSKHMPTLVMFICRECETKWSMSWSQVAVLLEVWYSALHCCAVAFRPELLSLSQSDCHHGGAADARSSRVKRTTRRHIPSPYHLLLSEIGERKKKKKDCPSLHRSFCRLFRPPARHTRRPVAAGLCGVNQTGDGPPSIIWFYWIIAVWRAK